MSAQSRLGTLLKWEIMKDMKELAKEQSGPWSKTTRIILALCILAIVFKSFSKRSLTF